MTDTWGSEYLDLLRSRDQRCVEYGLVRVRANTYRATKSQVDGMPQSLRIQVRSVRSMRSGSYAIEFVPVPRP